MNRNYFVELYQYNDWANRRVWECVMKANDEDYYKDNSFSVGSLYIQLLHTLAVERWWIGYLATGELKMLDDEAVETYKPREKLRELWDETNQDNLAYIASLTGAELQRNVRAPWWEDENPDLTVSQVLTQVANHSTDHRAQTMAVLHTYGYDGIGQDFLAYLHRQSEKSDT